MMQRPRSHGSRRDKILSYRQRSHDKPLLLKFQEELLAQEEEEENQKSSSEPLDELVKIRKKHEICFREVHRQSAVYSEQLAQVLAKVWQGEEQIASRLIEACRVARANAEKCQAEKRAAQAEASKREYELDARLRKKEIELNASSEMVRESESRIESLQQTNDFLKDEVIKLRLLIGRYIEGRILDDTALERQAHKFKSNTVESYKRAQLEAIAKDRRQSLQDLDEQLDSTLCDIAREHQRQHCLLKDLALLSPDCTSENSLIATDTSHTDASPTKEEEEIHLNLSVHKGRRPPDIMPPDQVQVQSMTAIPLLLREQMATFPATRRIPSVAKTLELIYDIYREKLEMERSWTQKKKTSVHIGAVPYRYFVRKYGVRALADAAITQLLKAIEMHTQEHKRIALFSKWIDTPAMTANDSNLLFGVLVQLNEIDSEFLNPQAIQRVGAKNAKISNEAEITRSRAVEAMRCAFSNVFSKDQFTQLIFQIKETLPAPRVSQDTRRIDLDDLLELATQEWYRIKQLWLQHAEYLFQRHKSLYKVKEEMIFADDTQPNSDRDVLLIEQDEPRRYQARDARRPATNNNSFTEVDAQYNNSTELVPLLNLDGFRNLISHLHPRLPSEEVRRLFSRGISLTQKHIEEQFNDIWHQYQLIDGSHPVRKKPPPEAAHRTDFEKLLLPSEKSQNRDQKSAPHTTFWHSPSLGITQWAKPFDMRNFNVHELTLRSFKQLAIEETLFAKSPLAALIDKEAPHELWPNSSFHLEQLDRERLAAAAAAAATR